jgi:hypothetical protein
VFAVSGWLFAVKPPFFRLFPIDEVALSSHRDAPTITVNCKPPTKKIGAFCRFNLPSYCNLYFVLPSGIFI